MTQDLITTVDDTCVYIHTRLDGVVFYVGIGRPKKTS